jgi:hypothetical protein
VHLNRKFVKLSLVAVAPLLLVSTVVLTGGAASAKAPAGPTISCTGVTATITFSPPLVPTKKSPGYSKDDTTTISNETVTGCTTSSGPAVTAALSATASVPPGTKGNTCSGFAAAAKKSKFTFVTNWNDNGGTSTANFKGSTVITSPQPGFQLSKGTVTGAFAEKKKATVQAFLDGPSTATFAACEGGTGNVTTLTIGSGNLSA